MSGHHEDRGGAKQPERFDPARAARLDDPQRLVDLPPERIAELLNVSAGIVLDFGTGTGTYALPLARLLPRVEIYALDEQPEMLALLRAKLARHPHDNVEPIEPKDLEALAGRVDRVLAINVLHEIGDRDLQAIPHLLSPQGEALFIDWNADVERPIGPPADHVYGVAEATARLKRFGLLSKKLQLFAYHYAIVSVTAPDRLPAG